MMRYSKFTIAKACRLFFLAAICLSTLPVNAAVYEVGPGHPNATPSDVPWESLNAGDTVRIHWRSEPYRDKWVINRQGTERSPIVVQGVAGPEGQQPVIDGNGATTRQALNYWSETRGVIKVGGASIPSGDGAAHVIIENLEIRSARPPYGFTDGAGNPQNYPNNAAAIYLENGDHITIRNCVFHDCGNGLFVAAQSSNILVEGNHLFDNGNVGSIYEHNSYTAAAGITFQFNHYGPLREGCLGNNLKDRSAGTVIRYNWIESGNRQLDLVDAEDSEALQQDPRYGETFVYGNILIEPDGAGNRQIVHYGGDSGNTQAYRKGTLYFFHNTVISTRTGRNTLFRLSTDDESVDCRNNIIFTESGGDQLELLSSAGQLFLTHNWLKPDWVVSFDGGATGSVTDDGTNLSGSDPGFRDATSQEFYLAANSVCRDAATNLHPAAAGYPVDMRYLKHQSGEERKSVGAPDLGAFEFTPLEAWRRDHFGPQWNVEGMGTLMSDPEGDWIPNLAEYAFKLDPNEVNLEGLPRSVLLFANGQNYLAVEFQRRPIPSQLVYRARVSGDLVGWEEGCEYSDSDEVLSTTQTVDVSDGEWTRVRLTELVGQSPSRFIGVQIEVE